jgi:hypothetical protein
MTASRAFANCFVQIKRVFVSPAIGGLLLFGLFSAGTPTVYGQALSLVWSDEFNSVTSSNIDTTKWTYDTGNNNGW